MRRLGDAALSAMDVPQHIIGQAALLLAFELIKARWHQPFNRMAWRLDVPQSVADFDTERYTVLGSFLSHVAATLRSVEDATSA